LKVFEVDHPETQAWKKERLRAACIPIPDSLRFIPVNSEHERLVTVLKDTPGFKAACLAFFSLLGVTPYLTRDALLATLGAIASMPPGSGVVFDYAVPAVSLNLLDRIGLEMLSARVAKAGEVFRFFIDPEELSGILLDLGFTCIEDLGQREINARYFQNRHDGLRIGSAAGRILSATVGR
jgi:methyltransferase (TIGR00027 family)